MKKMSILETSKFNGGNLSWACGLAGVIFYMYAENHTISDETWYAAGCFYTNYCVS
jgi:hypothetical protein